MRENGSRLTDESSNFGGFTVLSFLIMEQSCSENHEIQ